MPHADVNGQRLYYEIHGRGVPLLCVMGVGSDLTGWSLQLRAFSARHRTVVFDNRDVGRSSYAAEPYEIRDMAEDTIGLADALGLDRFHLLGLSMGGAIAQEVALAHPQRVISLTLCVSFGGGGRWAQERARVQIESLPARSEAQLLDEMMLLTLSEATYEQPGQVQMMRSLIMSYEHRQRRAGFVRQLRASAAHEARGRLSRLSLPVHVIAAEQDRLVPEWKSRELAELIPGARFQTIGGAAHAVNIERPDELARLVLEFLERVDKTAG